MKTAGAMLVLAAATLVGCSPGGAEQEGAPPIGDATYRLFQSSTGSTSGSAVLEIISPEAYFDVDGTRTQLGLSSTGRTYVLCPGAAEAEPTLLSGPITISGIAFERPAIFGDCGAGAPERVTVVDLATPRAGSVPAFSSWVEFCLSTDADCPQAG